MQDSPILENCTFARVELQLEDVTWLLEDGNELVESPCEGSELDTPAAGVLRAMTMEGSLERWRVVHALNDPFVVDNLGLDHRPRITIVVIVMCILVANPESP